MVWIKTALTLIVILTALLVGTNTATADIYKAFNRFCMENFGAEREPEIYRMFGKDLKIEEKGFWEHISEKSACICFQTNLPAKTYMEYGASTAYGSTTAESERCFSLHIHYPRNLKANTEYHYRMVALDERGNKIVSADKTFKTKQITDAIRIPDDLDGPPYTLDKENGVYLVTEDINSDSTAIYIRASGITLDLGGNTITYNEKPQDTSACGIRTGGRGFGNLAIKNGIVKQGKANSGTEKPYEIIFDPFFFYHASDIEIAGVTIIYSGMQVGGLKFNGGENNSIHHNILIDRGTELFNRHIGTNAISFGCANSVCHHNLVKRCRHRGIGVGSNEEIYSNEIYVDSYATNSYGIMYYSSRTPIHDLTIHHNRVFGTGYHPIGIGAGYHAKDVKVYSNYIQMQGAEREERWSGGQGGGDPTGQLHPVNGIRVQKGPQENIEYFDNTIVSKGRGEGAMMRGLWVIPHGNMRDVVFRDNRIIAIAEDDKAEGYAIAALGTDADNPDELVIYKNNTVISNICNVRFADNYAYGGKHRFISNTFVRSGDYPDYKTIRFGWRGWKHESYGHVFTDSSFEGRASYDEVAFDGAESDRCDFAVQWTLTVKTLPSASISIKDRMGKEVFSGETKADGEVSVALTQYILSREGKEFLTPHTITVAKEGFLPITKTVAMDKAREFSIVDLRQRKE